MKYLKVEKQLELLNKGEYDKLLEYAQWHNLNHMVVKTIVARVQEMATTVSRLKERLENQSQASIH